MSNNAVADRHKRNGIYCDGVEFKYRGSIQGNLMELSS